jgi:transcriptional regulator with XRE-family HTH domain
MESQNLPGDTAFGRRLRYLRDEAGLTQQQLAEVMREHGARMHRSTIGKIEAGERVVSIGEAAQFADVLGIDLTQLINVGRKRLVTAQLKVASLEIRAGEYGRQRDEAQILLDHALGELETARARLKEVENEQ